MIKFKRLNANNLTTIRKYIQKFPLKVCDFSIGVIFMWDNYFRYEYTEVDNTLILKLYYGKQEWFLPPVGENVEKAIIELEKYCVENYCELRFTCVDDGVLPFYLNRYGKTATYDYDRKWSDYIYDINEISTFSGKKFSGQRNHINKFKKLYAGYKYKKITKSDVPKLNKLLKAYKKDHKKMGVVEKGEFDNTVKLLDAFVKLKLFGGYIEYNGKPISFSIGEYCDDTLVIHVEKALREYQGVYPTTFNEFVNAFKKDGIKYVNREDDSGDEGLRTSKLQYKPITLLNKYYIEIEKPFNVKRIPNISYGGLYFNKIADGDKLDYYRLYVNRSLNKYWGYDYKKDYPNATADDFIKMVRRDYKNKFNVCLAIRNSKNGKMIGEAVLHNFGYDNTVEIGVRLFKKYHGKGYGKTTFIAMANYVEKVLGKTPVTKAYIQNKNSISAMIKAGFVKTGEDKKYYYFVKN